MKLWDLVAACQNQWKENSLTDKNPNFKIEVTKNEKTYNFTCNYYYNENWLKIRNENVFAFEIKNETLYIKLCSGLSMLD